MTEQTPYERFVTRYESGEVPWDDSLPPPEVQALVSDLPVGRALDLGCGYGRTSIYLAQHGWHVDGIDFVPQAVAEATQRAMAAGVAQQVRFHHASVTDLAFLEGPYSLAVDIGCMHALDDVGLQSYRDGLLSLLAPGATYLLFVRLRDESEVAETGPRGILEGEVYDLFKDTFHLTKKEYGLTTAEGKAPWRSGWFWFQCSQSD